MCRQRRDRYEVMYRIQNRNDELKAMMPEMIVRAKLPPQKLQEHPTIWCNILTFAGDS